MSTKGSIAGVSMKEVVGEEIYHASIHVYHECFESHPQPVYFEMTHQGVFSNQRMVLRMPQAEALTLADDLARWLEAVRAMGKDTSDG